MYAVNIAIDDVINALSAFVVLMLPLDTPVVRGQTNLVPPPFDPFVVLTEIGLIDLSIPYVDYMPTTDPIPAVGTGLITGPSRIDVQIDFYGASAGDYCRAVLNAYRTGWGYDQFPSTVKPLYTSDGRQSPLIMGEEQYESRWTLTSSLQYNPIITVPQDFADELGVAKIIPVDIMAP